MKDNHQFDDRDAAALDRDLSDEQLREWNAIYASYRSESLLTAAWPVWISRLSRFGTKKPAEGSRGASPVWW